MIAVEALLFVTVAAAWLAALGSARLRAPFDRLHCVIFAAIACGLPIAASAFAADGVSDRALKTLLLVLVLFVCGAAVSHVIGRAIGYRRASGETE